MEPRLILKIYMYSMCMCTSLDFQALSLVPNIVCSVTFDPVKKAACLYQSFLKNDSTIVTSHLHVSIGPGDQVSSGDVIGDHIQVVACRHEKRQVLSLALSRKETFVHVQRTYMHVYMYICTSLYMYACTVEDKKTFPFCRTVRFV